MLTVARGNSGGIALMMLSRSFSPFSSRPIYIHDMGEDPDMNALKKGLPPCFCTDRGGVRREEQTIKINCDVINPLFNGHHWYLY